MMRFGKPVPPLNVKVKGIGTAQSTSYFEKKDNNKSKKSD